MRSWGVSPAEAAERLGVTVRTVQRYEAALRGADDAARTRSSAPRAARLEDYAELRSWGEPMENAAERLGVSFRTAQRYEAALREDEAA